MKVFYTLTLSLLTILTTYAQRGKDGTPAISSATVVNLYTPLTANASVGNMTITVGNSGLFAVGDLIYIIQMQGASVNAHHGGTTGPWFDSNAALPTDTAFGRISNYNNTGMNEFAQVSAIPSGTTTLVLDCGLKNNYDVSNIVGTPTGNISLLGKVQVVRVPRYTSLTLNAAGSITSQQWNGTTGGVAVVEVETNAILNSTGAFNVVGQGFRGGRALTTTLSFVAGGDKFGSNFRTEGGAKGESIAGDSGFYRNYASIYARGAVANGGGGGCTHNAGGGGGANGGNVLGYKARGNPDPIYATMWNLESASFSTFTSSGGGRGGYSYSSSNQNVSTVAPGAANTTTNSWSGDQRRTVGGVGGRPIDYSTGRLFIGGGGGAGHGNNAKAGSGGNGGGLVQLVCYGNLSGSGTILADGGSGSHTALSTDCADNDGAGGGGGGGTIVLSIAGTTSLTATTPLSAKGGDGGNVRYNCFASSNSNNFGPGAGGGAGFIAATSALPATNLLGGTNGTLTGISNNVANNFPPNGATKGGVGSTGSTIIYTLATSSNTTICENSSAVVTATSSNSSATINWYSSISGGTIVASGNSYTTSTFPAAGNYTVYAGSCPGTYRKPIVITVNATPTLAITGNTNICSGNSATLTVSGSATSYTWQNGGSTSTTIAVTPSATTNYSLIGSIGTCTAMAQQDVSVTVTPTITVNSPTICSGQFAVLTPTSSATTYSWSTGATTNTISVNPTGNTTYTVSSTQTSCNSSKTVQVTVTTTPTITVNSPTICAGQFTVLTPTSSASSYSWSTGAITNTISVNPSGNTTYTVSSTQASCNSSKTVQVTVNAIPTLTITNASICSGQATTLTASGASNYTWSPSGITTATAALNPSNTTTYTVVGATGTCTNSASTTITVTPTPTITGVANQTICPTQTATFTAGGATNFTWTPGNTNGTSYTIAPLSDATLSVLGANGTCTSQTTASITIGTNVSIGVNSPTICVGQTATLTATGISTYTWSNSSNSSSIIVTPTTSTTYTISGNQGLCSGTQTVEVTVVAQPTLSVTGNTNICSGNSTTLTASGTATSYVWQAGGQTTSTISVNPTSTTNYTVTGSNGVCTNSATTSVSVTTTPTITGVAHQTICANQTATFTAGGANTYTWQPNNTVASTYTISPSSTSTISVVGATGNCASLPVTVSVTVNSNVTIAVTGATICPNQTTTISASGVDTYTWSTTDQTNTITVNPSATAIYTVNGTLGTCLGTQTVEVTVVAQPTVSVTGNTNICSGNSTTLTASGTATSYVWQAGGETTSTISVNPTTSTNYTVTGSNGVCTNSATTSVSVTTTPTIAGVAHQTICANQLLTFNAGGASTYTWQPNNTVSSTYTIAPSSSTTISVIGATGNCLSATETISITIGSGITVSVNSETLCAGQTTTLTASGITTFTWSDGSHNSSIIVTPTTTTEYTVSGNNGVCFGTNTATVTVNALPTLTVTTSSTNICTGSGLSANLNVSGADTYTWSNGVNGSSQSVNPTATTVYTVTGIDVNGCTNTVVPSTTVNVTQTPTIQVNSKTICFGQTATLTATGATSYSWSTGSTSNTTLVSPTTNTFYLAIGEANGCVSQISQPGIGSVFVIPTPSVVITTTSIPTGCADLCIDFTAVPSPTNATVSYNYGDGNLPSALANHCYTTSGIYTVTANASVSGCSSASYTLPTPINVVLSPIADFTIVEGSDVLLGTDLTLNNTSQNNVTNTWTFCDNIVSTQTNVSYTPTDTGYCCIKLVTVNSACKDSVTKCVMVNIPSSVVIPNVFTPNGDGKNDVFKITANGITTLSCVIFDRWGLKMTEWNDVNGSWNGTTSSGVAVSSGAYFYIVKYTNLKNEEVTEKGYLTVFKD